MALTEEMFSRIAMKVKGTYKITYQGQEVDLTPGGWKKISMIDSVTEACGVDFNKIQTDEEAVKVAEERNALLYCGEYGVINLADLPDTLAWYKAINAAFVKYNIGRCAWSYREMDFGLCDEHAKPILNELKHYL
jgi:lysyl-tRNA synthetase class II